LAEAPGAARDEGESLGAAHGRRPFLAAGVDAPRSAPARTG